MALVVEDGTGKSDAQSYLSISDADTYHTKRSNTLWTSATSGEKEVALIKATQFLDVTFNWKGVIYSTTQALGFPRYNITDKEGRDLDYSVPEKVEEATAELALYSLSYDLIEVKDNSDYIVKEKVGEIEVEYLRGVSSGKQYTFITRILNGLYLSEVGSDYISLIRT